MSLYDRFFDHVLARTDPERIHHAAFGAIRAARPLAGLTVPALARGERRPVAALGLVFPHAVGLAAGFDKDARGVDALAALGFGHVEIGTVTGRPQPGNPRPRLFRLPADRAIVNRMGFNNDGAEAVAARLADRATRLGAAATGPADGSRPVLGINIGKTKVVPGEDAVADYETSTGLLAPYADYLVVNVSSPNTPGLRDLQAVEHLAPLLDAVRRRADAAASDAGRSDRVPMLVKIAPDLADADVLAVADLAVEQGLDGIVATNTTVGRAALASDDGEVAAAGAGGLSGAPLRDRSRAVLDLLRERVAGRLDLVSVGGVATAAEAQARLDAGASLVQAYTGVVYGGPLWPARTARDLAAAAAAADRKGAA